MSQCTPSTTIMIIKKILKMKWRGGESWEWLIGRNLIPYPLFISLPQGEGGWLICLVTFEGEIEQATPAGHRHSLPFPDVLLSSALGWSLWLLTVVAITRSRSMNKTFGLRSRAIVSCFIC
jgi:hypothetical protein